MDSEAGKRGYRSSVDGGDDIDDDTDADSPGGAKSAKERREAM